jgi:hypothetical protein
MKFGFVVVPLCALVLTACSSNGAHTQAPSARAAQLAPDGLVADAAGPSAGSAASGPSSTERTVSVVPLPGDSPSLPTTRAEFVAFAMTGNAAAIKLLSIVVKGAADCPVTTSYATVDPAISGLELAADESAYFVQAGMLDGSCKAALLVYYQAAEQSRGDYTAGRVVEVDVGADTAPALFKVKF